MRTKMPVTLAAAACLSGAILSNPAKAMIFAMLSTSGVATEDTGLVQKAHYYGYYRHHHYGYHRPYFSYYGPYYGRWGFYPQYWYRGWWW